MSSRITKQTSLFEGIIEKGYSVWLLLILFLLALVVAYAAGGKGGKELTEASKNISEVIALLAAGSFFAYKAFFGYFRPNMSVKLDCTRHPVQGSNSDDYLVIKLTLIKGDRTTVYIHDAQARIKMPLRELPPVSFIGVDRRHIGSDPIATKAGNALRKKRISWTEPAYVNPFIGLSPGDSTEFSCYQIVPRGTPCEVEVVVVGQRERSEKSSPQWRASYVSVPYVGKTPGTVYGN